jgi:hypothetical protein
MKSRPFSKYLSILCLSVAIMPASKSFAVEVKGAVTYKMPQGQLVNRDVILDVPPMGQGKVKWISNGKVSESHSFRTRKVNNRVIFEVLFVNPVGAPPETAMALSGSYLRGTNGVIYYGDFYGRKIAKDADFAAVEAEWSSSDGIFEQSNASEWTHGGGFMFTTLPFKPDNGPN